MQFRQQLVKAIKQSNSAKLQTLLVNHWRQKADKHNKNQK